jgi:hypothetical protein
VGGYSDETYYRTGEVITYESEPSADYTAASWVTLPHVCVSDPAYATALEITAPSGQVYEPVYAGVIYNEPGAIFLPPEAYLQGGLWQVTLEDLGQFPELGMDSFQVTIDIQPAPSDIRVGVYPDGRLLAVGFDTREPVVAVLASQSADDPFELDFVNQVTLEADEDGAIDFDKGGSDMLYVLIGASAPSHVSIGEGIVAGEGAAESLYQRIWGN